MFLLIYSCSLLTWDNVDKCCLAFGPMHQTLKGIKAWWISSKMYHTTIIKLQYILARIFMQVCRNMIPKLPVTNCNTFLFWLFITDFHLYLVIHIYICNPHLYLVIHISITAGSSSLTLATLAKPVNTSQTQCYFYLEFTHTNAQRYMLHELHLCTTASINNWVMKAAIPITELLNSPIHAQIWYTVSNLPFTIALMSGSSETTCKTECTPSS